MSFVSIIMSILMTLFPFINWGTNNNQEIEQVTPPAPPIVEAVPETTPETPEVIVPGDVVFEAENASATLIATRGNVWELEFKVDGSALFFYGDTCTTVKTGTVVSISIDTIATAELVTIK